MSDNNIIQYNPLFPERRTQLENDLNELIGEEKGLGSDKIAHLLLGRLTFRYESLARFQTSEEQVDSFLKRFTNMVAYRDEIIEQAREFRKSVGLPL